MYFLTLNDLYDKITDVDLDTVTDSQPLLIDNAELKGMSEIDSYLRTTYDMKKAWAARGTKRNYELMQCLTIVMLYHLHARVAPGNIPVTRLSEYTLTLKKLEKMADSSLSMDLPILRTEPAADQVDTPSTFKFRSEPTQGFRY
jgi:hypothetical protein